MKTGILGQKSMESVDSLKIEVGEQMRFDSYFFGPSRGLLQLLLKFSLGTHYRVGTNICLPLVFPSLY